MGRGGDTSRGRRQPAARGGQGARRGVAPRRSRRTTSSRATRRVGCAACRHSARRPCGTSPGRCAREAIPRRMARPPIRTRAGSQRGHAASDGRRIARPHPSGSCPHRARAGARFGGGHAAPGRDPTQSCGATRRACADAEASAQGGHAAPDCCSAESRRVACRAEAAAAATARDASRTAQAALLRRVLVADRPLGRRGHGRAGPARPCRRPHPEGHTATVPTGRRRDRALPPAPDAGRRARRPRHDAPRRRRRDPPRHPPGRGRRSAPLARVRRSRRRGKIKVPP